MERRQKKKVRRVKKKELQIFQVGQEVVSREKENPEKNMQSGKWMSTTGKTNGREKESKVMNTAN